MLSCSVYHRAHGDANAPSQRHQCHRQRCGILLQLPLRSKRMRLVGWIAVTLATMMCRSESVNALLQYHHHPRLARLYRGPASHQTPPTACCGRTVAFQQTSRQQRQQRNVIYLSTFPKSQPKNHRLHTMHRFSYVNSDNQNTVDSSPDVTIVATVNNATSFDATQPFHVVDEPFLMSTPPQLQQRQHSSVPSAPTVVVVHDHLTRIDQLVVVVTALIGIGLFYSLMLASGPGAWRFYVAGGVCAATSHSIPTPIDVVKTRKQVDPALRDKNFIEATKNIVQQEGVRALLAGLGPTAWGYLLEGAVKFGVYENLKPTLTRLVAQIAACSAWLTFLNSQIFVFMLCGAVSGAAAAMALCPMEALRIRMVAEPTFAPNGWLQGGYRILKYEGVGGLWKGMTAMLYKQVPYTVMKNVSFDVLTKLCYALLRRRTSNSDGGVMALNAITKFSIPFLSAMIASILSCISSQPGDMLLSLVNAHRGNRRSKDFVQDILHSDQGVRGFFVGTKTRLLHVGMIVTLQLIIYDFVKRLCGIAATGSV